MMEGVKPWQLAVIVLGLLGGTGLLVWNAVGSERIEKADKMMLVDIATGQLFEANIAGRRAVLVPAKHPETGERTLMPVGKDEQGTWRGDGRHMSLMSEYPREQRTAIDGSGLVISASQNIKRFQ